MKTLSQNFFLGRYGLVQFVTERSKPSYFATRRGIRRMTEAIRLVLAYSTPVPGSMAAPPQFTPPVGPGKSKLPLRLAGVYMPS